MVNRVSIYMITGGEIRFIQDLLEELLALADTSEYYAKEVSDAIELLEKLKQYDTAKVVEYFKSLEEEENERSDD